MEQSKKPEKTNATVTKHLTLVPGLGTGSLLMAYNEPFASPDDRVFVELREIKRDFMSGGGTEVFAVVYREDGMRQAFITDIVENPGMKMIQLDDGVDLRANPVTVVEETVEPVKKRALWIFKWDVRRGGKVVGQFIATDEEVDTAIGSDVYFGEILGKHSEVRGTLDREDLRRVTDDEKFIRKCEELRLLVGYNPLKYIRKEDEE
jgi:hypothetical protein